MTALFVLLPIYGIASFFNQYFKKNISSSIFFSISFIISVLFVFGMFGFLKIGAYGVFYSGILLFAILLIMYNKILLKSLISVPSVMFILSSVVYLYFMKEAHFFFWDEYSHWGAFVKDMFYFGSFYGAHIHMSHLNYPPGISIWDYFVVKNIFFSEGNVYFAYFLILFSSTLMMYEKLKFKDLHWIALVFSIQMVLYSDFGHWFSCIYVDHVIGAMFAGLILSYLSNKYTTKDVILFIFPLVSIVLVKEIGLYFGLAFLGFVLLHVILNYKLKHNSTIVQSAKIQIKLLLILVGLFIIMFLVLKSWGVRQESLGIKKGHQTMSQVVKNIVSNKQILKPDVEAKVKKRFWKVVEYQQLHKEKLSLNYNEFSYGIMSQYKKELKLSTIGCFIFYSMMLFFILFFGTKIDKQNKINIMFIYMYMLTISIVYLFILYFSFLVAFGDGALRIPSYVRYMNMAILPMFLVGFAILLPIQNSGKKDIRTFLLPSILLLGIAFITKPYFKPLYSQLDNRFASVADKLTSPILKKIPKDSTVFVIFPIRNNGSLNNILKYYLIPFKATVSRYDFEKKSFQDMLKIYSKYSYIWFVKLDKKLIMKNRVFLRANNNRQPILLYKIIQNNTKLKIIPIR